ncbi:MAG: RNA polymerase sigma factor [Pseudomonadota bacterium]
MTAEGRETDEDIAARAKTGDRHAFDLLVQRHKEELYRFVRRYVGQSDDAQDVLQNCLLSAWTGLARYDPARPFIAWLRIVALNKCRDFGRRQTVRRMLLRAFTADAAGYDRVEVSADARDSEAEYSERLTRLDRAIWELPALYKDPLLLTAVSGLTQLEAAEILKTTPKAVEMRLYRARRKLLAVLERHQAEKN